MLTLKHPFNTRFTYFLGTVLLFLLSGCTETAKEPVANEDPVTVANAYVRAVPPGQSVSAAFMELQNNSDETRFLIKAASDVAESVELHEHIHKGNMMQMRQVEKIALNAHSSTALKPGGYHVMLIGLTRPLAPGSKVTLSLTLDNGQKLDIEAPVKKIEQSMKM